LATPVVGAKLNFEILGDIRDIETMVEGPSIRDIARLRHQFGSGRWSKLKGIASVGLRDGTIREAEIHWYEAHGVGKKKLKIKRFRD
jgi:hypothetical protein